MNEPLWRGSIRAILGGRIVKSKRWREVESLYRAALEREPSQRRAFLTEACAGDEELVREIESLLAYDQPAERFLNAPAMEIEAQSMAADHSLSLVGQQLSHYKITEKIGSGGMGEVYRARDTRLGRDVAIKVSSDSFTERFERETRLVAALNHPNICTLHDVGSNFLVMELVEGSTLAERIDEGPIPVDEALGIAKQIIEALEAAHERGIIHRDLKPNNVKIKPDGTVKVLDFGLAKLETVPAASAGGDTPTAAAGKTESGIIVGTPGYMSPEQARGKLVDRRTDIWAFGAILYEMLAGRPPFVGETVSDIMAAVLQQEPDWTRVPAPLRRLVRRCLEKDPKRRLRDIGDAAWEIEHLNEAGEERLVPFEKNSSMKLTLWFAAIAVVFAAAVSAIVWRIKPTPSQPQRRFELPFAAGVQAITMSPDGSLVAYIAGGHLYVRAFEALQPRDLGAVPKPQQSVGPQDAALFWSTDSKTIGFATDGTIRSVPASGGPVFVICKVPASGEVLGAAWRVDGMIVFSVWRDSLYKVSASGGAAELYLAVNTASEIDFHQISALKDNRVIVQTHLRGVAGSYRTEIFDGKERVVLSMDNHAVGFIYAPPGYFLFSRNDVNRAVWAVPFSAGPLDLSKAVVIEAGAYLVDAAEDGTLLMELTSTGAGKSELTWVDRSGFVSKIPGTTTELQARGPVALPDGMAFALSPDSHRVMFVAGLPPDIFIRDLSTAVDTRLTFDGIRKGNPSWFPAGDHVLYSLNPIAETSKMVRRQVDGTGDARELGPGAGAKISPDGRHAIYLLDDRGRVRLRYADVLADGTLGPPQRVFSTDDEPNISSFDLSPDAHLIAYTSVSAGSEPDIFLTQFPSGKGLWQVPTGGNASLPRFSHDGHELFYVSGPAPGKLMAVSIASQPSVTLGPADVVVDMTKREANGLTAAHGYDVSRDGRRFLFSRPLQTGQSEGPRFVVLQNWLASIKK